MRFTPTHPDGLREALWRAVAVYRVLALVFVAYLTAVNSAGYAHPPYAWLALAVMAAWTAATGWGYADPARRRWPLLGADLAVTAAVELSTLWVVGLDPLRHQLPTLAPAWIGGVVLAWAVAGGRRRGLAAAVVLGAVEGVVRGSAGQAAATGIILMLLAGLSTGHVARLAADVERRLREAAQREAAAAERERLARGIHDSVLQVLAMVARRGARLDGEAGELARLAGEQEAALRALIGAAPPEPAGGEADLRALLRPYAGRSISVAAPAAPVPLPEPVAAELARAVGAALANVARHGGPATRAWVLVEDEPAAVTVTVRDDGPGIVPGRLDEAAADGRLGVAQSILGRLADLGGTATIHSEPDEGTEVELRVPRTLRG
ncbi:histidine kinase [Pilimelia anulata]|uniref:Histidine kinase n=1 Tax=Pilimelia anulata TaxID=53371 RepID=A0A8J3BG07_9ACTN|nr:DUF5931 domain-containing protein [Pilimelia anulata]GGK01048.1 histidine kinase [Pilimelia anulata]